VPAEFRLRAAPPPALPAPLGQSILTYRRRGSLTEQVWELPEHRERPVGSFPG
jgi:hypothetical protein